MRGSRLLALFMVAGGVASGCAAQQTCVKPVGAAALTPAAAASGADPAAVVSWGGVVVASFSDADAIASEVTAYPLDRCGRPAVQKPAIGHFLVRHHGAAPRAGQQLTATGRLLPTPINRAAVPTLDDAAVSIWPDAPPAEFASPILFWPFLSIGIYGGGGRIGGGFGIHF
jgi:outer membrane lipoprotein